MLQLNYPSHQSLTASDNGVIVNLRKNDSVTVQLQCDVNKGEKWELLEDTYNQSELDRPESSFFSTVYKEFIPYRPDLSYGMGHEMFYFDEPKQDFGIIKIYKTDSKSEIVDLFTLHYNITD